jgi:non-heme chloroperoxidase
LRAAQGAGRWGIAGSAAAIGVAAASAAAWALQHRAVRRAQAHGSADDELVLPEDLVHRFVDVPDGRRVHAMERGEGPPIVLVHGFMLSGALWVHQLRDLAARHRVVAVDLSGHGQSIPGSTGSAPVATGSVGAGSVGPDALGRLASDLWAVLEALDVEGTLLVGHSLGGMTVLRLALDTAGSQIRSRVDGLALVSTTAGPLVPLAGARSLAPVAERLARLVIAAERRSAGWPPSGDLRWWVSRMGFGADAAPAQVRFVEEMHGATSSQVFADLLPALTSYDVSGRLGSLELPAMVVVGTRDRILPARHARRLAAGLERAELVELPRCGHEPMLERPNEFSRLLDEFSDKLLSVGTG